MLLLRRAASRRCLLQSSSTRLLAPSPLAVPRRQKVDYIPSFVESRKSLTKIVATIGPASEQFPELQACVKSGMRIMRLNFSHATYEEATLRINNLRKSHGVHTTAMGSTFNLRAILLDIQGPKIRTGSFKEGSILLEQGKEYILTTDESVKKTGDEKQFYVDYAVRKEGKEGRRDERENYCLPHSFTHHPALPPSLLLAPLRLH